MDATQKAVADRAAAYKEKIMQMATVIAAGLDAQMLRKSTGSSYTHEQLAEEAVKRAIAIEQYVRSNVKY